MTRSYTENWIPKAAARRLVALTVVEAAVSVWMLCSTAQAQITPKHATVPTHQTLMDYAASKAAELATPLTFTTTQSSLLRQGAADEDSGTRSLSHGYNPLVDGGFPFSSMTARNAAAERWTSTTGAFASGNLNGGDDSGAWHFLGRTSHLMQDMTSPMHVLGVDHAGILGDPYLSPACQFEGYWENNDATLRSILSSIGGPLHSSVLDAKASEKLDAFSSQRLTYRFNNSCPNKVSDDVRGWLEVLSWTTFFRATFWGEVSFGSSGGSGTATTSTTTSTTFSDGTVASKPNVLHTMFSGQAQWIAAWDDNYYQISDRNGYVFRWMSWSDIDDWSSVGRFWADGQQDSSVRSAGSDDDSRGARITGRFWFDTRELGKATSDVHNRYCYPNAYPDGTAMTDHLHQYYGNYLYPLTVRYNAGLLGLANRRVTVRTADSTQANGFSWGRMDNVGNGPTFNTASSGQSFYFAAKSPVTLTAPASNTGGRAFLRWLRDGSTFLGNSSRTVTINDSAAPIGANGVIYTAEYTAAGSAQLTSLSISGPSAVNENGTGQFIATAYFNDGSQQTVTSSASWSENSSVTTISSSGLLSAGSIGSDTTVTVSASYTSGTTTRSANATVTVVNSASCGTQTYETVVNGNFAGGSSSWALSGSFQADSRFSTCYSCPGYAYLASADGTGGNNLSGTLSQSVTIPANATSATLGYYCRITTSDSTSVAYDHLLLNLVLAGGTLVGLDDLSNVNANSSYVYRSFNITAYKGQTITIRFTGTTDSTGPTVFRVDDVSVIVTAPNPVTPVLFGVGGPTSVAEGSTAQYNAIVVNCDGSIQSVTPTWSENSSVTTISSSGLLTVGSVSSDTPVTVTATYNSSTVNYPITVLNRAPTYSYLAISGPSALNENSSAQYTATAIFSDGTLQSVSPSWSENSSATTISGSGLLTASEVAGNTTVTVSASYTIGADTRSASQDVLISDVPVPRTLNSIAISGPGSVSENSTGQYAATAYFSDGSLEIVSPVWSEDSTATTISASGLLGAGEVTSDTPVIVSASYTYGGATRSAQKSVSVLDVVAPVYTLTVSAINGTVMKNPDQASYASNSIVVLTATGAGGYQFASWSGDAAGNQNPLSVTMTTNKSIVANFIPVAGTTNVLFTDAFSDNVIDPNKWTTSGNTVTEASQTMQVLTTVTDGGGCLLSVPVPMNPVGDVTISRRVFVHYANNNYVGYIAMRFGSLPSAGVFYANATYSDANNVARYGTFIGRSVGTLDWAHGGLIGRANQTNVCAALPVLWDTWFNEKIVYSPTTGNLQYFVNDQSVTNCFVGVMPTTNTPTVQFGFRAWGWYTGHQELFDDFVVTQTAAAATQVTLTGMSVSNRVFRLVLNGPAGSNYVVKATTNLVNWLPLSTNTVSAGGWFIITDPAATNMPRRFYRAVAP